MSNNNNALVDPSADDKDGIRVDEGGEGDVVAVIVNSRRDDNAAEGIEIDETGHDDVVVSVTGSSFSNNGDQPQRPSDLEDGLDVDEAGFGNIWIVIANTVINGNEDEGLDLDEADEGGVTLTALALTAEGNRDENVKVTQLRNGGDAAGAIVARFSGAAVNGSREGDGIKLESFDDGEDENLVGSVYMVLQNSTVTGNDSDHIQLGADSGDLALRASTAPHIKLKGGGNQMNATCRDQDIWLK